MNLALGTKEFIIVEVIDNSITPLTDLSALSPKYDVLKPDGVTFLYTNQTVGSVSGMFLNCLIDTTTLSTSDLGKYLLWVKFTTAPEVPKLGPIPFYLVNTA